MKRNYMTPLLCVCVLLIGCQNADIVPRHADRLILYSLECDFDRESVPDDAELFHGDLVLKKVQVDADEDIAEILNAVRNDIANAGHQSKCFEPHHAIRIYNKKNSKDLIICYLCRGYMRTENGNLNPLSYPINVKSKVVLDRFLATDMQSEP